MRMRKCRFCTRCWRVICLHSTAGTNTRPAAQLKPRSVSGLLWIAIALLLLLLANSHSRAPARDGALGAATSTELRLLANEPNMLLWSVHCCGVGESSSSNRRTVQLLLSELCVLMNDARLIPASLVVYTLGWPDFDFAPHNNSCCCQLSPSFFHTQSSPLLLHSCLYKNRHVHEEKGRQTATNAQC